MAPTKGSLNNMLEIAKRYADLYDIIFNASKCKYIVFGLIADSVNSYIQFNDVNIQCSDYELHLGNPLNTDDGEQAIVHAVNTMYYRLNSLWLLSKFNFASINIKYYLFKAYCMVIY